jgi:hypothetical protein
LGYVIVGLQSNSDCNKKDYVELNVLKPISKHGVKRIRQSNVFTEFIEKFEERSAEI